MSHNEQLKGTQIQLQMVRQKSLEAIKVIENVLAQIDNLLAAEVLENPAPVLKKENGRLTDEGVKIMKMMLDAGKTDTEIAQHFDITAPAVKARRQTYELSKKVGQVTENVAKLKDAVEQHKKTHRAEFINKIAVLASTGMDTQEIGKRLGISRNTVVRALNEAAIEKKKQH